MEENEKVNVVDNLMQKETINVVDNLYNTKQPNETAPIMQQSSIWAWLSLFLAIAVAPLGLGLAIYAYTSNKGERREIEVVSLMSAGIAAFICLTTIIQFIL